MAEAEWSVEDHATTHPSNDITWFAEQYGLTEKLDILQRAVILARNDIAIDQLPDITPVELRALRNETKSKWNQPYAMYLCIFVNAFGAMGQGWAQTSMNGANIYWPALFRIGGNSAHDTLVVGLINCAIYLSNGLLGSWLVAPLNHLLGRRGAVFTGALISLVCNVGGAMANNWQQLLVGRLCYGVGLGIISSTLNVFAAECVPAAIRGGLGVAWQMFCAFGIFLGFLTNMLVDEDFETYGDSGWRIMLAAASLPTTLLLVFIFLCPESPAYWVKHSNRYDVSFRSLCSLRNTELQAARDVLNFYQEQKRVSQNVAKPSFMRLFGELFTIPRVRRATLAAWCTMFTQQICGINIVTFYSSTIFVDARFSPYAAEVASTIFGLVNFRKYLQLLLHDHTPLTGSEVGAFPAIWTMDSLGRRSLPLVTLPLMAMSMAVAALSFDMPDGRLRFGIITSMIYLFCVLYSLGMGPVPAAYSAEVFPLSHREIGASSAMAVTNLFAALLSLTFPALLSGLGARGSFLVYAAGNVLGWWLVFLFVRETKLRTLEQLDGVFSVRTRDLIKYQLQEVVPWWTKKYVLLRKDEELSSEEHRMPYSIVRQDEDD